MGAAFDFGLAWCWEYDRPFVEQIDALCVARGVRSYLIYSNHVAEATELLRSGRLSFEVFLDRASDMNAAFDPLAELVASKESVRFLNHRDTAAWASDKALILEELERAGVLIPRTIVVPPYETSPEFDPRWLEEVSPPLAVKPARGGGGQGIGLGVALRADVQRLRAGEPGEEFLLQEMVRPAVLDGRRAWFRCFYVGGEVIPHYWDDQTRTFGPPVSEAQALASGLGGLFEVPGTIAAVSGMDIFSTELCLADDGRLYAVDWVNDQPDFRRLSVCPDGVPDETVDKVCRLLVDLVERELKARAARPRR